MGSSQPLAASPPPSPPPGWGAHLPNLDFPYPESPCMDVAHLALPHMELPHRRTCLVWKMDLPCMDRGVTLPDIVLSVHDKPQFSRDSEQAARSHQIPTPARSHPIRSFSALPSDPDHTSLPLHCRLRAACRPISDRVGEEPAAEAKAAAAAAAAGEDQHRRSE